MSGYAHNAWTELEFRLTLNNLASNLDRLEATLPVTYLDQSSFDNGTYRITAPGRYVLTQDIRFNPNPSTWNGASSALEGDDWMPTAAQIANGDYPVFPNGPYHLGFFAAIAIESDDVIIDLNSHTLEQSIPHYLQQRFFTLIELAPTPFIHGQGPSDFGPFQGQSNIKIHNGVLGLTAHASIHGNGPTGVILEKLTCFDYEQAAFGINGGKNIIMRDINIERNSRDVFVRATYSQGRFIRSFLQEIIDAGDPTININGVDKTGTQILATLVNELDSVYDDVVRNHQAPTSNLFVNLDPKTTCDGNIYGIVLNRLGAVVGPFLETTDYVDNHVIALENIHISDLDSQPVEIPSLCVESDHTKAQRGPVGDVIRIDECTALDGSYSGDALSDAQFYMNKHATLIGRTSNASTALYDEWLPGTKTLTQVKNELGICDIFDRDAMSHNMKGTIGLFLSGARDVFINGLQIEHLSNRSPPTRGEHHEIYEGNRTRGVGLAACKRVYIANTTIKDMGSSTADVYGIDFITPSSDIIVDGLRTTAMKPAKFLNSPFHRAKCSVMRGRGRVTGLEIR
jgi:hypothetical protein